MLVLAFNKAVGRALRDLRDAEGWTLSQMACFMNMGKVQYTGIESGLPVGNDYILKACVIHKIRVSQFFFLVEAEYSAMTEFNWIDNVAKKEWRLCPA